MSCYSTGYIQRLEPRLCLASMPAPWLEADVGSTGAAGSATLTAGTLVVRGAGADIGGKADAFHYVYQPFVGDGQIVARFDGFQQNDDPQATAGVMFRESLAAGAKFVDTAFTADGRSLFRHRLSPSYQAYSAPAPSSAGAGWIKLVRSKTTFTSYYSTDGSNWTVAGSETISMKGNIFVGLAVCSHASGTPSTATFSDVVVPQNILNYGASPAAADNAPAINRAIAASLSAGNEIFVPPGTFRYASMIELTAGKRLYGAGAFGADPRNPTEVSELRSTNASLAPVHMTGVGSAISDLRLSTSYAGNRLSGNKNTVVYADGATQFSIRRVDVTGAASAGILSSNGAGFGQIVGNRVRGTLADGIHNTHGAHDLVISGNTVYDTGDDMIAVVSYLSDPQGWSGNVTIADNAVTGKNNGRGISVVGGHDVTIDRNTVTNAAMAGIIVASESAYNTFGVDNVTITRNVITNANTSLTGGGHGGILVTARQGYAVANVTIGDAADAAKGNVVTQSNGPGVAVNAYTAGVRVLRNLIDGATDIGVKVTSSAAIAISGNTIRNIRNYGIFFQGNNTGATSVTGNVLQNVNSGNVAHVDVINVSSGSSFSSLLISGNDFTNPAGYVIDRFIECHFPAASIGGNTTNTGEGIWIGARSVSHRRARGIDTRTAAATYG